MSEKKGFLSGLFGGNKSGGCCNMEIVEETGTEVKDGQFSECGCSCGCNVEGAEEAAGECCPEAKDDYYHAWKPLFSHLGATAFSL